MQFIIFNQLDAKRKPLQACMCYQVLSKGVDDVHCRGIFWLVFLSTPLCRTDRKRNVAFCYRKWGSSSWKRTRSQPNKSSESSESSEFPVRSVPSPGFLLIESNRDMYDSSFSITSLSLVQSCKVLVGLTRSRWPGWISKLSWKIRICSNCLRPWMWMKLG